MTAPGGWPLLLAVAETDGAANTATTRTSLTPAHARFTAPPTNFWVVRKKLRLRAQGRVTTGTSGTLSFSLGVGSVDAWTSGALTMVASQTNQTWWLEVDFTLRAVGAAGSATANGMGIGKFDGNAAYTGSRNVPTTAPAVGTSFDPSLTTNVIDLFALWSVASTNSITLHEYELLAVN